MSGGGKELPGGRRDTAAKRPLISAVVVCRDDAARLGPCLDGLRFCDEVVVVDLQSSDDSQQVARDHGATVLTHQPVEIVERVRAFAAEHARHCWILFVDPDEEVPPELAEEVQRALSLHPHAAGMRLPWWFHFKGKPLRCTQWGLQDRWKLMLIHRDRVVIRPWVHNGFEVRRGDVVDLEWSPETAIRHYWANGYRQLIAKHRRYLMWEGEARAAKGQQFAWRAALGESLGVTLTNLFRYRGWRGGVRGIFLSFMRGWYTLNAWFALRAARKERRL